MYTICVVGGGASGISFVYNFTKYCSVLPIAESLRIMVFDKTGYLGGEAYSTSHDWHVINMPPETMSADIHQLEHFSEWIKENFNEFLNDKHPPRFIYKEYLDWLKDVAAIISKEKNVMLEFVHDEVVDLLVEGERYLALTRNGYSIDVDKLVLCTGHNPPGSLNDSGRVLPYTSKLDLSPIDSSYRIAIIGCNLTAVDAIVDFFEQFKVKELTCISHSGVFPSVQPIKASVVSEEFYNSINSFILGEAEIYADDLVAVINNSLDKFYAGPERILGSPDSYQDLRFSSILSESIFRAVECREHICSYLSSIHQIVCLAWMKMEWQEKDRFMKFYCSSWMKLRHAMPLKNAEKIQKKANEGKLSIYASLGELRVKGNSREVCVLLGDREFSFDYLVNCTGPSYKIEKNGIYANLIIKGLVEESSFGGLKCDPSTLKAIGKGGVNGRIFLLGSPAKGETFYTTAIEAITKGVEKIITSIGKSVEIRRKS